MTRYFRTSNQPQLQGPKSYQPQVQGTKRLNSKRNWTLASGVVGMVGSRSRYWMKTSRRFKTRRRIWVAFSAVIFARSTLATAPKARGFAWGSTERARTMSLKKITASSWNTGRRVSHENWPLASDAIWRFSYNETSIILVFQISKILILRTVNHGYNGYAYIGFRTYFRSALSNFFKILSLSDFSYIGWKFPFLAVRNIRGSLYPIWYRPTFSIRYLLTG